MTTDELIANIYAWGKEKGLHDTDDPTRQMLKLVEEMGELSSGLAHDDHAEIMDAIGDMVVVLVQLSAVVAKRYCCAHSPIALRQMLEGAWRQIEHRTGRTENGVFIKSEGET